MPPRHHHHHHHHRAGPTVAGAVVAGAAAGAVLAASTSRRPAHVHHRYRERVVIVSTTSAERVVRIVCPAGVSGGMIMEILVDGREYFVTVPPGTRPGMPFDARIPAAVVVAAPPPVQRVVVAPPPAQKTVVVTTQRSGPKFVPAAAIVSDNHGSWTRVRYETLRGAERAWGSLGMFYASVLFVQTPTGAFGAFKEWGVPKAVAQIKKRFEHEFKRELFPELCAAPVSTAVPAAPPAVPAAPPSYAAAPPPVYAAPPPPAYGA